MLHNKPCACFLSLLVLSSLGSCRGSSRYNAGYFNKMSDSDYVTVSATESQIIESIAKSKPELCSCLSEGDNIGTVVDDQYWKLGLLETKDDNNNYYFYSSTYGKNLMKVNHNLTVANYSVISNAYIGFTLGVKLTNNSLSSQDYEEAYLIDGFGNVLIHGKQDASRYRYTLADSQEFSSTDNKIDYISSQASNLLSSEYSTTQLGLRISLPLNYEEKVCSVIYQNDLSLVSGSLPYTDHFNKGDKLDNNNVDLSRFGLPDTSLRLLKNNHFQVVATSTGNKKSDIVIPSNATVFFVGQFFYYQQTHILSDDSEDYDYLDFDSKKKSLMTRRINMLTGKEEDISVPFLISIATPFQKADGVDRKGLIICRMIEEDLTLGKEEKWFVINENLNRLFDGTDYGFLYLLKANDNRYFDSKNGILYDKNLSIVANLSGFSPSLDRNGSCLIVNRNEKYGIADLDGKLLTGFEFDAFTTGFNETGTAAVKNGNKNFWINRDGTKRKEFSGQYIKDGLFVTNTDNVINFFNGTNSVLTKALEGEVDYSLSSLGDEVTQYACLDCPYKPVKMVTNLKTYYFSFGLKELPNADSLVTIEAK
ncbi:MAG: hypothetical protein LKE52_00225 [Bacilli bacterium]|nr:hypothetical protein [Bacilli bacterium]